MRREGCVKARTRTLLVSVASTCRILLLALLLLTYGMLYGSRSTKPFERGLWSNGTSTEDRVRDLSLYPCRRVFCVHISYSIGVGVAVSFFILPLPVAGEKSVSKQV